jgi:hypothetical protein
MKTRAYTANVLHALGSFLVHLSVAVRPHQAYLHRGAVRNFAQAIFKPDLRHYGAPLSRKMS